MSERKRALVTGGAGFLGSHLCGRLLEEGLEVVCMDNLITGSLDNIEGFFGRDGFTFVKHDVTNFIHVPGELDFILHFASPASPIDYLKLPIQTLKVGSLGTHKALGLAKSKGARFLLASTSEVYGDPLIHPQPENYWGNVNPVGPRGVYDEAKRFAEALTMAYHRYHDVDTRIVRIFNTFGPRMRKDDGRAVPTFINQALAGEPTTRWRSAADSRALVLSAAHPVRVEGRVRAVVLARETATDLLRARGRAFEKILGAFLAVALLGLVGLLAFEDDAGTGLAGSAGGLDIVLHVGRELRRDPRLEDGRLLGVLIDVGGLDLERFTTRKAIRIAWLGNYARELGVDKIVISECGHGYRSTRCEGPNWAGMDIDFKMESAVETMLAYLKEGRIKVDKSKNKIPVTFHDS